MGCDDFRMETPHEQYMTKVRRALDGYGFVGSRSERHYDCYSCGSVVFGIELHWRVCAGRSETDKELHQQLTSRAKTLVLEQLAVSRGDLKDKVWEAVCRRLETYNHDKIEVMEQLKLLKVCEEAGIDAYHLERALKLLVDEKRVVVINYFGSSVYMQDIVISRLKGES